MQITLETKPFATLEMDALVSYVLRIPIRCKVASRKLDQFTEGLLKSWPVAANLLAKRWK